MFIKRVQKYDFDLEDSDDKTTIYDSNTNKKILFCKSGK